MKRHSHIALAALLTFAAGSLAPLHAQEENQPKFKIQPTGRILFDGALYFPDGDNFSDGVAMPDIRMGAKVTYGNWYAKIDVGYGMGKLGFKDVYMQYSFNKSNLLRLGYFVHQFGLNASTSSSMKPAMEAPVPDNFFAATGRNLGLMYLLNRPSVFLGVSAIIAGTNMTTTANETGKVSVGGLNRLVYRPFHGDGGFVAQAGISLWYQTALHTREQAEDGKYYAGPGFFNFNCTFPTRVNKTPMLGAEIDGARGVFKLSPELVVAKDRIALEGQYYYMRVTRTASRPAYTAQGGYALLRGLLIGKGYGYSFGDAGLATPAPKSLELVLGYNYTDATDRGCGILGGRASDYSATLNYYINKYMIARLRYSYTDVSASDVQRNRHVSILQARVQFLF